MKKAYALAKEETLQRRIVQPLLSALKVLPAGQPRLLAVSGGVDSRALMEAWARHKNRNADDVVVCVDHGVRIFAKVEAEAVVDRARVLGFSAERVTLERAQEVAKDEASLRKLRYAALLKVALRVGAVEVLFAHHRDDDVESFFLHLLGQGGAKEGAALPLRAPLLGTGELGTVGVWAEKKELWAVRPFRSLYKKDLQMALLAWGAHDVNVDDDDKAQRNARSRARAFLATQQEYPQLSQRLYVQSVLARERVAELEFSAGELDENLVETALQKLKEGVQGSRSSTRHVLESCAAHWVDPRDAKPIIDAMMQALLEAKPHARRFQLRELKFKVLRDVIVLLDE